MSSDVSTINGPWLDPKRPVTGPDIRCVEVERKEVSLPVDLWCPRGKLKPQKCFALTRPRGDQAHLSRGNLLQDALRGSRLWLSGGEMAPTSEPFRDGQPVKRLMQADALLPGQHLGLVFQFEDR